MDSRLNITGSNADQNLSKSVSQTCLPNSERRSSLVSIKDVMRRKQSNCSLVDKFINTMNLASQHLRKDDSQSTFEKIIKKKP